MHDIALPSSKRHELSEYLLRLAGPAAKNVLILQTRHTDLEHKRWSALLPVSQGYDNSPASNVSVATSVSLSASIEYLRLVVLVQP